MQEEAETEKLGRERNKKLSIGQLDLRREVSHRQEELKDKLFVEIRDKLANFMETRDYLDLLEKQIGAAKAVTLWCMASLRALSSSEGSMYTRPADRPWSFCRWIRHIPSVI